MDLDVSVDMVMPIWEIERTVVALKERARKPSILLVCCLYAAVGIDRPCTAREVAEYLNISQYKVRHHLVRLVDLGLVQVTQRRHEGAPSFFEVSNKYVVNRVHSESSEGVLANRIVRLAIEFLNRPGSRSEIIAILVIIGLHVRKLPRRQDITDFVNSYGYAGVNAGERTLKQMAEAGMLSLVRTKDGLGRPSCIAVPLES